MKPLILFALLIINTTSFSQNFWNKVEGLYGSIISSFAKDSTGNLYYASLDLFKSDSNGTNWVKVGGPTVNTFAVFYIKGVLYASASEGLFKSTDSGVSWVNIFHIEFTEITKVIANSQGHLFAIAGSSGGYRSTDHGNTWRHFLDGMSIRSFHIDTNDIIYSGVLWGGLYKSGDNGNSWKKIAFNDTSIYSIQINSSHSIFVCAEGTIYKSTNNAESWILANNGIYSAQGTMLYLNKNNVLFASNVFGVYKSTNEGNSWTNVSNEIGEQLVYAFVESSNGNIFAGGDGKGIYKTTNEGLNWSVSNTGINNTFVQSICSLGDNLVAVMHHSGIYYSSNNGLNWSGTNVNVGGSSTDYSCIAKDNSNRLYCSIESSLYSSVDSGKTWIFISAPSIAILNIAFSADNNIFVGLVGGGLMRSTNGGYNWLGLNIGHTTVLATNNNGDMYSIYFRTLYRSTNNGINWYSLPQLPTADNYSLAFDDYNNLYLSNLYGIQFSSNSGQTWQQKLNLFYPVKIIIDRNNIYTIQDWGNKFYYSTNLGSNWDQSSSGLENVSTCALTLSSSGELFCGTVNRGIYKANASIISVSPISGNTPKEFKLFDNFPNPFNPSTIIKFDVPFESLVSIVIYDLTGREIEKLTDQYYKPGQYEIDWNGSEFSSGVYIVTLYSEQHTLSKKIVLLK